MNIQQAKKIYMIGIKGVGMTMLAQFLHARGIDITGSDTNEKFMTDQVLHDAGIKIVEGFSPENIPKQTDVIVYSTAYNKATNPELNKALASALPILTYAQALGQVFNEMYGIAVVGTHGKTTTSAWLGYVLKKSGLDPSVMVGARVPQFNGSSLLGVSDYLVVEADEYQNKLKNYNPKIVLLNNIDYDHPDFFRDKESYKNVFVDFIKKIPRKGILIANIDDPIIKKIARPNCRGRVVTYAIKENADYIAYSIKQTGDKQIFSVKIGIDKMESSQDFKESDLGSFSIALFGNHNIYNALAVIATAIELNIPLNIIRTYLAEFIGTARRMEEMGSFRGSIIVDDYAHHPAEIKTTITAVKQKYNPQNLVVVFHPHTYSRTKALLLDFASSFEGVDELIVLDIYGSAREKQGGVHSQDLVDLIKKRKISVRYIPTLSKCEEYLRLRLDADTVLLLMGAGDVFRIGDNLLEK